MKALNLIGMITLVWLVNVCSLTARAGEAPVDFSGYWELYGGFDSVVRPEHDLENFTPEAKHRLAAFHKAFPEKASKWPMSFCLMQGMPWTMLTRARTYATEIYQTPDRIFLKHEGFDLFRDIHIGEERMPARFGGSNQGYSVARWNDDELVIVTEGLTPMEYSELQRTADAKVTEYWRFVTTDEGEQLLETELFLEDPELYENPARGIKRWRRMPDSTVVSGYNCINTLWDDHVEAVLQRQHSASLGGASK